jgi:hypothetical protein
MTTFIKACYFIAWLGSINGLYSEGGVMSKYVTIQQGINMSSQIDLTKENKASKGESI